MESREPDLRLFMQDRPSLELEAIASRDRSTGKPRSRLRGDRARGCSWLENLEDHQVPEPSKRRQ